MSHQTIVVLDFGVDTQFSQPAGDELRVLRAEIKNDDGLVRHPAGASDGVEEEVSSVPERPFESGYYNQVTSGSTTRSCGVRRNIPSSWGVFSLAAAAMLSLGPMISAGAWAQTPTGTIKVTQFFDRAGNFTREIAVFPGARVTFSANGKSISTVTPSVEHLRVNPDGSATLTITCLLYTSPSPRD